ncbi:MAG: BTAD domain-containing putative transcriptional regulator [Solirubrobacteraceae bacterium]
MEFRILGPLEVVEEGHPLALAAGKQRALLAILLLRANEVVSSDELIDSLWGERPPASAPKSIQIYVSQLRKIIGGPRDEAGRNGILITRPHGYELHVEPGELDLHRFDRLLQEGRDALEAAQPADAAAKLREALSLWRGPALADFTYEPFARPEIARLEEIRLVALEDRIEADLALGRHANLIGELEAQVTKHPLRERLRGQLMLALYRSGRQAEALELYQQTRRLLRDELGLEPSPALQELERAILRHDAALTGLRPETSHPERAKVRNPRTLILAGSLLLLAAVAAGLTELSRDSGPGGLPGVAPNELGQINPKTNKIVARVPVGTRPDELAYGRGALWVVNQGDSTISRVNPVTRRAVRTIPLRATPTGLSAGEGFIWVTTDNGIKVIDPRFDDVPPRTIKIRESPATTNGPFVPAPMGIAFAQRASWMINGDFFGQIWRINTETGRPVEKIVTGTTPTTIATGGGDVWVSDVFDNTVTRIDRTGVVTARISVGHGPTSIAVGGGAVWVVDTEDDNVKRIDPGTATVVTTIPVGHSPGAIAIGGGAVWVANRADGTISRIDPRSNKPAGTIDVGQSPVGLAFARGSLWVSVQPKPPTLSTILAKNGGVAQIDQSPFAIDPATQSAWGYGNFQLEYATCAKLLNYPDKPAPAGWRLQPEIAKSMPTISRDGRTYTFTIRRGYKFSPPSNAPVTAATLKYTIERSLSPTLKPSVVVYVNDIVGERAYIKGKASHISGVTARGDTLSIRLTRPAGDFPTRITLPPFCAVPLSTPMHPTEDPIPSAGPYYVASHVPGVQTVLRRNPNYAGPRPRRLAEIVYTTGFSTAQSVARALAGQTDYVPDAGGSTSWTKVNRRYGAQSPAARAGHQRVFINLLPSGSVDTLTLNTSRPLFTSPRLRLAVNYAIDRQALARLGGYGPVTGALTALPIDHYLVEGTPGYRKTQMYPARGDLRIAKQLAGKRRRTAVMYACDFKVCLQEAQVVKKNLAAIGISVEVRTFPMSEALARQYNKGEPYDIGLNTWRMDYPDPFDVLNLLLDGKLGINAAHLNSPMWNRRLEAAAQLSGDARARAYKRLDTGLARQAAPWVAFMQENWLDLFSDRVSCQTYQPVYGMDLATLCIRRVKNH